MFELLNGVLMMGLGSGYLALSVFNNNLISFGIIHCVLGLILVLFSFEPKRNRHTLLVIYIFSFFFGYGAFIGPALGIVGLYKYYF